MTGASLRLGLGKKTAFDKFKTGFEFAHGRHESRRCPFTRPLSISAGWLLMASIIQLLS